MFRRHHCRHHRRRRVSASAYAWVILPSAPEQFGYLRAQEAARRAARRQQDQEAWDQLKRDWAAWRQRRRDRRSGRL